MTERGDTGASVSGGSLNCSFSFLQSDGSCPELPGRGSALC